MPPVVRDATIAVERAMAVAAGQSLPQFKRVASTCGLYLDRGARPHVADRAEPRAAGRASRSASCRGRGCARIARAVVPEALLMNAVAAYLMPLVVQAGAHTYRLLTFESR